MDYATNGRRNMSDENDYMGMVSNVISDKEYDELRNIAIGLLTDDEINSISNGDDRDYIREIIKEMRV